MGTGGPACEEGTKPCFPQSDLSLETCRQDGRALSSAVPQQVCPPPWSQGEHGQGWEAGGQEHVVFLGFRLCKFPKHGVLLRG